MYSLSFYHFLFLRCLLMCCALYLGSAYTMAAAGENAAIISLPATVTVNDTGQRIRITTFKQYFDIRIEQKKLLGHFSDLQRALYQLPLFFEGQVDGDPTSWVRLSQERSDDKKSSQYSGHIFTAGSLYKLQYRDDMGGQALAMIGKADLNQSARTALISRQASADKSDSNTLATRAISIGIAIDSRFNELHNGRGLAKALSIINGVDGLYQSQLGLAIEIESFRVYDDPTTDPMREFAGTMEQALENYRGIRLNDEELPRELALTHLFSGHSDPQSTIGLGWIGTACRLDGYDLSISTPFPYDMLLAAHEIAHNLGAPHDDDRQCNSDPSVSGSEVMWSELSGSTQATFSTCSLNNMRRTLDAACVNDNINVAIALNAEPSDSPGQQTVTITVQNHDSDRTAAILNSVTTFPTGTSLEAPSAACAIDQFTLTCQHLGLHPNQLLRTSVTATFTQLENSVVSSVLVPSGFTDTERLDNRAALQVQTDRDSYSDDNTAINNQMDYLATASGDDARPPLANASVKVGGFGPFSLLLAALAGWLRRAVYRHKSGHP